MKKQLLLFSLALIPMVVMADNYDWLNFSTGKGGNVVQSVLFRNGGRLTFGQSVMHYEDENGGVDISYEGAKYIFFSENKADAITLPTMETEPVLSYSSSMQQIRLSGEEPASQIRLVSMQGSLLRSAVNTHTISTEGLQPGVIVATAVCNGKNISKKFIIK